MSYQFTGGILSITGQFASPLVYPVSMIAAVKYATHPATSKWVMGIGNSDVAVTNAVCLRLGSADDQYNATSFDGGGAANSAISLPTGGNYDGAWFRFLGEYISDTSRRVYVQTLANTFGNVQTTVINQSMSYIRFGSTFADGANLAAQTLIAECAVWNAQLTDPEKTNALAGQVPTSIQGSLCRGYWPFSANNSTQVNQGADTDGDLTVNGPAYNVDHPTVISAGGMRFPLSGKFGGHLKGKTG